MNQVQIVVVLLAVLGLSFVSSQCTTPPPVFKWPDQCCSFSKLISETVMNECRAKIAGNPKVPAGPGPIKGSCRTECAFNETGLYANNALNEQQIRTTFVANVGAPFAATVNAALDSCLPLAKSRAAEFASTVTSGSNKCSPITVFMIICVNTNMLVNCPAANFKADDADCVSLQNYFRQCPNGPN